MTTINADQVQKISDLAQLEFDSEAQQKLAQQLSTILTMVETMNQYNTDDIEPMAHPLDIAQPLRHDEITEHNIRTKAMELAPEANAGLYLVPKVIND
jgi:aspartyl-tRNA(Asn)/glutamyl-tRNA(Gln) amidotransferase subunit C